MSDGKRNIYAQNPNTGRIEELDDTEANRHKATVSGWVLIDRPPEKTPVPSEPQKGYGARGPANVSQSDAANLAVRQGLSFGLADEAGAVDAVIQNQLDELRSSRKGEAVGRVTGPGVNAPRPTYEQELAARRSAERVAVEQNPATYTTGDLVSGMVLPSAALGSLKNLSTAQKLLKLGKAGAVMGGIEGATRSEGGLMDRAGGAAVGGVVGGVAAPALNFVLSKPFLRAMAAGGAAYAVSEKVPYLGDSDVGQALLVGMAGLTAMSPQKVGRAYLKIRAIGKPASERDALLKVLSLTPEGRTVRQQVIDATDEGKQIERDFLRLMEEFQKDTDFVEETAAHGLKPRVVAQAMAEDHAKMMRDVFPAEFAGNLEKMGVSKEEFKVLHDKGFNLRQVIDLYSKDAYSFRAKVNELTRDTPADPSYKYQGLAKYLGRGATPESLRDLVETGMTPDDIGAEFGLRGPALKKMKKNFRELFDEIAEDRTPAVRAISGEEGTAPGTVAGKPYFTLDERRAMVDKTIRADFDNAANEGRGLIDRVKEILDDQHNSAVTVDKRLWGELEDAQRALTTLENRTMPTTKDKADLYMALDYLKAGLGRRQKGLNSNPAAQNDIRDTEDLLKESLERADIWGPTWTAKQKALNKAYHQAIGPSQDYEKTLLTDVGGLRSINRYDTVSVPDSSKTINYLEMYKQPGGDIKAQTQERVVTRGLEKRADLNVEKAAILGSDSPEARAAAMRSLDTSATLLDKLKRMKEVQPMVGLASTIGESGMRDVERLHKFEKAGDIIKNRAASMPIVKLLQGGKVGGAARTGAIVGGVGYLGGKLAGGEPSKAQAQEQEVPISGIDAVSYAAATQPERLRAFADELITAQQKGGSEFEHVYERLSTQPSFRKLVDDLLNDQESVAKSDKSEPRPSRSFSGSFAH